RPGGSRASRGRTHAPDQSARSPAGRPRAPPEPRADLLRRRVAFFFPSDAQPLHDAPDRGTTDAHLAAPIQLLGDFVQRAVVLLLHHGAQLPHTRIVELRRRASAVWTRLDAAGLTLPLEVVLHGLGRDLEPRRQVPHASLGLVIRVDDALPEVGAVRSHRARGPEHAPCPRTLPCGLSCGTSVRELL